MRISREQTDDRLLSVLRDEIGSDTSQAYIDEAVRRHFIGEYSAPQKSAKQAKEKIEALTTGIETLAAVLAKTGVSAATMETLSQKEKKREVLQRTLAQTRAARTSSRTIARRVREKTIDLRETLEDATAEARTIIATLMGPIGIELREGSYFATYDDVSERLLVCAAGNVFVGVVAGVGFEPTTFGL